MTEKKRSIEALWRDLFSNTSQWWDHRPEKINAKFPDFKHKCTQESLWLGDARNPPWVQVELAAIPVGTLQSNVFAWSQRLKRLVKARKYIKAMQVYHEMQQERLCPDSWTFLPVLNACAGLEALEEGRRVHRQIVKVGCESDVYVGNCLVDMYAKCGSIVDAWNVFNKMRQRNVVTWNTMIGGHVKCGQELKAMELFCKMQQEGVEPDAVTFVGLLKACASVLGLEAGRHVHEQIIQTGCESNLYVATCLVDMYAKCGSIENAWEVFIKMQEHDVVTWNSMIGGYVKSGQELKAIQLFQKMEQAGVKPDTVTFVGMLNACASLAALEEGRCLHKRVIQVGYESDVYVANCLVNMYAKCGSMGDACNVFNKMQEHDVVTWNAMVGGFAKSGQGLRAVELFWEMQQAGVEPNAITFIGVLNACASIGALEDGRRVHKQIIQVGLESDVYVATCLVDMYAKCGSIEDAFSVFDRMVEHKVATWNAMIGGYVKSGQELKALKLFWKMQQEGAEPDSVTFVGVLNACASVVALEEGRRVHTQIIKVGCEFDIYVANCLVDMYAKCGSIQDAWSVFKRMQEHDVVTWNAIIGRHVKSGQKLKAMELFWEMQQEGVEPDAVTFVGMLNACASVAALEEGRRVHKQIIERGCESNLLVANCLVDMYAKCGSIEDAWSMFSNMREQDVVTWNAMIGGYAMHGQAQKAIELFRQMGKTHLKINETTFTCLLSACGHVGLVKEGLRYFKSMSSCFDVLPSMEHEASMVDLLARSGRLVEAEEFTKRMPKQLNVRVWRSLLGGCRVHGNVEMGERAAKHCWELAPGNASGYVLLSNIYAAVDNADSSAAVEEEWLETKPGCSWIEVNNIVQSFLVDDKENPQIL